MAISETIYKNTCTLKLNNGTDSSGNIKTVNVSLGVLAGGASDWNATKAANIVGALTPCLSLSLYQMTHGTDAVIES